MVPRARRTGLRQEGLPEPPRPGGGCRRVLRGRGRGRWGCRVPPAARGPGRWATAPTRAEGRDGARRRCRRPRDTEPREDAPRGVLRTREPPLRGHRRTDELCCYFNEGPRQGPWAWKRAADVQVMSTRNCPLPRAAQPHARAAPPELATMQRRATKTLASFRRFPTRPRLESSRTPVRE
jgi:hypothetical protein